MFFSNPEYMSIEDLTKYKDSNNKLGPPPSRVPKPPPKTPPVILNRKSKSHRLPPPPPPPKPPVHLYQNVNLSHNESSILVSEISSSNSSSSNATMIIRKSPPQRLNVYEQEDDDVCSIISNSGSKSPIPFKPVLKLNTPKCINRLSLLNKEQTPRLNNRRKSEPVKFKRMKSLSPIMTSSRADLNGLLNKERKIKTIFKEIEEEIYNLEPTIIKSPPEPNKNCFTNANYFSSVDDLSETCESDLESLVLQPPSPFKSPKSDLNKKPNKVIRKKVSFMIDNQNIILSTSCDSNSSSCSSLTSTGSSELVDQKVQELDLIKEKIFSKIFSNEDYFVSDLINKIESASASSIPSSCSSSTSSGYKSNHSNLINMTKTNSIIELKEFIDYNRERLDRLKIKRNQLIGI